MLSKDKSRQSSLIKYTILFPLILGMLVYTSTSAQEAKTAELEDKELYTICEVF